MTEPERLESQTVGGAVWRTLLLVAFVAVTIPQCLSGMGIGLDASWGTALHLAADRDMVHGRDFVFTYGPLGFALVAKEVGDVNLHATAFRLGMNAFWWVSVGLLLFRTKGYLTPFVFAATMALSGVALENEFNYALTGASILPVACFLLLAEIDRRPAWAIPAAFFAGAVLLTKFNVGVAATGSLGLWSLYRLARNPSPKVLARLVALSLVYFASMAFFFRIYGGPLSWLLPFIKGSKELASAYSTQMGVDDPVDTSFAAVVALMTLAVAGLVVSMARRSALAPAFVIMIFPMFVMYKGAVVRQSIGHFLLAWPVMISLTALVLPIASRSLRPRVVSTFVVALLLCSGFYYAPASPYDVVTRGARNWLAICNLKQSRADMKRHDSNLKASRPLPAKMLARIGTDAVDIYPWETSYIWSNDLKWRPRPVFQSYTAYTPYLDLMGADLYRSPRAPKFIVYTHDAIDFQHPCMVDSRTWIEMLRWYDCVEQEGEILLLQRRNDPRWQGAEQVDSAVIGFEKSYSPPDAGRGLVFMKADFELSLLGKIQAMLYKVDPPVVRVQYRDGEPKNHRLVWQNSASGFLISSLPRDVNGVRQLFQTGVADPVIGVSFHDPSKRMKRTIQVSSLRSGGDVVPTARSAVAASPSGATIR